MKKIMITLTIIITIFIAGCQKTNLKIINSSNKTFCCIVHASGDGSSNPTIFYVRTNKTIEFPSIDNKTFSIDFYKLNDEIDDTKINVLLGDDNYTFINTKIIDVEGGFLCFTKLNTVVININNNNIIN